MDVREKNLIGQATGIKNIVSELLNNAERIESNLYRAPRSESSEKHTSAITGLEDILSLATMDLKELRECLVRIDEKVGKVGSE